jgi:hypothetical protein
VPAPLSNGEALPPAPSARDRDLARAALARADEAARRVRMDRRRFLHSAAGMAAILATINACDAGGGQRDVASGPGATTGPGPSTSGTTRRGSTTTAAAVSTSSGGTSPSSTGPGGVFAVPEPEDVAACEAALRFGGELIIDVHTHHVVPDGPWVRNDPRQAGELRALAPAGCTEAEPLECLNRLSYLEGMFLASDTTIAMLSNVPASSPDDDPLPFDQAVRTRELYEALVAGGAPRVLLQHIVAPNFGPLGPRLDEMAANAAAVPVSSFKVYTGYGPDGRGWALDDPAIGLPFLEQVRRLGVRVVSAHKGLPLYGFDASSNGPRDIGAVAAAHPDLAFVVYHAAWQRDVAEGPYDPDRARLGVSSLVKSLQDHGIGPNANVYAELGTTWRELIRRPTEAAHVLGKLLVHVGADNVLWGTDAVWTGSPQPQIMAFRAFQITAELQDRHGYPALTDDLKRKILGENAARLYRLRGDDLRCALDADALARARAEHPDLVALRGASAPWIPRGPVTRRDVLAWMARERHRPWSPVRCWGSAGRAAIRPVRGRAGAGCRGRRRRGPTRRPFRGAPSAAGRCRAGRRRGRSRGRATRGRRRVGPAAPTRTRCRRWRRRASRTRRCRPRR